MLLGARQTLLGNTYNKYPFDYRVEYFEVASLYPLFNCGELLSYNSNWQLDTNPSSQFNRQIIDNIKCWSVSSFPNPATQDQKNCGTPQSFTAYFISGRWNFGGFGSWLTLPTVQQTSEIVNTNTVSFAYLQSLGNRQVKYGAMQGNKKWEYSGHTLNDSLYFHTEEVFPHFSL